MSCDLTFAAAPRISRDRFRRVLVEMKSPAAAQADELYIICLDYGLDPGVALAFFYHESKCGTAGQARFTKNWGNIRKGQGNAIATVKGWAWYGSWAAGLKDWCILIRRLYIGAWHLDRVGPALDRYAPSADHNSPTSYANTVCSLIQKWQQ